MSQGEQTMEVVPDLRVMKKVEDMRLGLGGGGVGMDCVEGMGVGFAAGGLGGGD